MAGVSVSVLLIEDSAFKLPEIVMKQFPFTIDQSDDQKEFNYRLSKCWRVAENAFRHLKARFRRIGKGLEVKVDTALIIIKACCILHNLCNNNNDEINEKWLSGLPSCEITRNSVRRERELYIRNEAGVKIRDAMKNYFAALPDDDDEGADDGPANSGDSEGGDNADGGGGENGDGNDGDSNAGDAGTDTLVEVDSTDETTV